MLMDILAQNSSKASTADVIEADRKQNFIEK